MSVKTLTIKRGWLLLENYLKYFSRFTMNYFKRYWSSLSGPHCSFTWESLMWVELMHVVCTRSSTVGKKFPYEGLKIILKRFLHQVLVLLPRNVYWWDWSEALLWRSQTQTPPNPNILISFRLCMHILVHTRVCLTSLLYFLIYAAIRIKLAFYDKI